MMEQRTERPEQPGRQVELVAIDMGYGHLRPAYSLAEMLPGAEVLHADAPPASSAQEQRAWEQARTGYEMLSRGSRLPLVGGALKAVLDEVTAIPSLYPHRDLSQPTVPVRALEAMAKRGLGRGLAERLKRNGKSLLTTFYAPAVLSDFHGCERVYCVVTDSDVNRVWAPPVPSKSNITYCAPSMRVARRLRAYGVPQDRIRMTGFPLPHALVGGLSAPVLRRDLQRRLAALDPLGRFRAEGRQEVTKLLEDGRKHDENPPHLVFAVGGAGAQAEMAFEFLPSLAPGLRRKKWKLTLVAGIRPEVKALFLDAIERAELVDELEAGDVEILLEGTHEQYFQRFNQVLHDADILWTKPSEVSFYGALGIPLLFSQPMGSHEHYNQRWAVDSGSGVEQYDPRYVAHWLEEMLDDGTLAAAAWAGYMRMPKFGLYRVIEEVLGQGALEDCSSSIMP